MARIRREDLVGNIASIECMQLGDATFCDSCPFYVPLTSFSKSPLLALLCLTVRFPICFCSLNLSKHPFMQKTLSMHVYAYLCQVWNFRHQLYTKHETGHWQVKRQAMHIDVLCSAVKGAAQFALQAEDPVAATEKKSCRRTVAMHHTQLLEADGPLAALLNHSRASEEKFLQDLQTSLLTKKKSKCFRTSESMEDEELEVRTSTISSGCASPSRECHRVMVSL